MNSFAENLLPSYISWMSDLAIRGYFSNPEQEQIGDVIRARTMAILRLVDADAKTVLLKFLFESGWIGSRAGGKVPSLIALNGADLREVNCAHYQMPNARIISAFLNRANFSGAFLYRVNFNACDLIEADLSHAVLDEANLLMADLTGANLKGASLYGTLVSDAQLSQAASMEDIQR